MGVVFRSGGGISCMKRGTGVLFMKRRYTFLKEVLLFMKRGGTLFTRRGCIFFHKEGVYS